MDVFLSYNRRDSAQAVALDAALRGQGLKVFLDTRELIAGQDWVPVLEEVIGRVAKALVVLIGPSGLGRWQHKEYSLGFQRQEWDPSFPVIPVLLPGIRDDQRPPGFLALPTWVNFSEASSVSDPQILLALMGAIRGEGRHAAALRTSICPYKGLLTFNEEDRRVFFGRDADTAALLATLLDRQEVCLIGHSGTGKSSLIRAGLLAQLRGLSVAQGAIAWDSLDVRLDKEPLQALGIALDPPAEGMTPSAALEHETAVARRLRENGGDFAAQLLHNLAGQRERRVGRFLIMLDQAEQALTPPPNRTLAEENAWRSSSEHALKLVREIVRLGPASLVVTIRADYYEELYVSPLADLTRGDRLVQTHGIGDVRAAIEGPANLVDLRFEDGLVDLIERETGKHGKNLPLLQHALAQSWAKRRNNVITFGAYEAAGGVHRAINNTAQTTYDSLGATQRAAAKRVFLRLIRPGERREHVRVSAAVPKDPVEREVAKIFAEPQRRLIFFGREAGQPRMEVAHEALVRGWQQLLEWVKDNEERLAARDAVRDWQRLRVGDVLPPGALLTRARELLEDPGDVALDEIAPLILASLEAERQAAEAARRARRGKRFTVAAVASLMLVGVTGAVVWQSRNEARIANVQRASAEDREKNERQLRTEAQTAREDAERQRGLAQINLDSAQTAQADADRQRALAERNLNLALGGASETLRITRSNSLPGGGASALNSGSATGQISNDARRQLLSAWQPVLQALKETEQSDAPAERLATFLVELSEAFLFAGDVDSAMQSGLSGLSAANALRVRYPERYDVWRTEVRALELLAGISRRANRVADGIKFALQRRELVLSTEFPGSGGLDWQFTLAAAREALADNLRWRNDGSDRADAISLYDQAREAFLGIIGPESGATDAERFNTIQRLAIISGKYADLYVSSCELDLAEHHSRENLRFAAMLAPSVDAKNDAHRLSVAIAQERFGLLLSFTHPEQHSERTWYHARTLEIISDMLGKTPATTNTDPTRTASLAHLFLGNIEYEQGEKAQNPADALFHFERAHASYKAHHDLVCLFANRDLDTRHRNPQAEIDHVFQRECRISYEKLASAARHIPSRGDEVASLLERAGRYLREMDGQQRDTRNPTGHSCPGR